MNRGKSFLAVCLLAAVVSAVASGGKTRSETTVIQTGSTTLPPAAGMPEHVPYMFLFHHLSFLKQKAEEFEKLGKGKSILLQRFREDAGLNDAQFQQLLLVALDCERRVAEQDKKAMVIINRMKAPYPDGKLPAGEAPPPLPPELITMQQERDAIILRARDSLRRALGEQDFVRFNAFVQSHIAPEIKADTPR